jgi:hypothetical protein
MKTSSAKAKGRRHQQAIRDDLRDLLKPYGIVDEDIESRGMGQAGEDLILSPAAKAVLNLLIEAKNVEKLNVVGVFDKHYELYRDKPGLKLLIHTRNRAQPLVTLKWSDLLGILRTNISNRSTT